MNLTVDPASIIEAAKGAATASAAAAELPWYETTPGLEMVMGVRAIMPLVFFLFIVLKVLLRSPVHNAGVITYGIILTVVGMVVFSIGLTYGLSKLGEQSGGLVPAAFMGLDNVENSPLYIYTLGLVIALGFAWALGFGATLAEPALNALGDCRKPHKRRLQKVHSDDCCLSRRCMWYRARSRQDNLRLPLAGLPIPLYLQRYLHRTLE